MRNSFKQNLLFILTILLIISSFPFQSRVEAAGIESCPIPGNYTIEEKTRAQNYIKQLEIPEISNGKSLNLGFLLNKCGVGDVAVVYGTPLNIDAGINTHDKGQYRYLGWDMEGNLYRNWKFRSDSRVTLHVAKNWVKTPWNNVIGKQKKIALTSYSNNEELVASWLNQMKDPYKESQTFLQSYNKRKGTNWTGYDLLDYAIIQQPRSEFSPGVVQMWNIWEPDGSWWYEMFDIPPDIPKYREEPDLYISELITPADAWVGESVPIKVTTKNQGDKSSGPFTVGIVGTNIKSEIIPNIPPGQIKTVTVNLSSTTSGIKSFAAKTDFGEAVAESNEKNNTKDFKIAFNKKNEPTTPIAIISHLEGDHRTEPEITIKPNVDPKLNDKLSYSPGKEPITLYEWKYTTPNGNTINKKPTTKDISILGEYLVELRVTNSKNKISDWAKLIVNVTSTQPTPKPSTTPTPSIDPEATPKPSPKRPIKVDIAFKPISIFTGEQARLENNTINWVSYTWTFSSNLAPLIPNASDFEHGPMTFNEPGSYSATLTATDEHGFSETKTTYLSVNDPKPTAIISGVTRWIQGRPFPSLHHLNNSYTPLASRGITMDWSRSERRFKKEEESTYKNGWPTAAPMVLGNYMLEGKVYDSFGRMSEWAIQPLEIVPDEPPAVEITAPDEGVRNNEVMLYIDASSPDGDDITSLRIEERYDSNGDGQFDEAWKVIYEGPNKFTQTIKYTSVGKRQYRATAKENFGSSAVSNWDETNIINIAPVTNFNVFGTIQQPDQGEDSGPPITSYTPESILRSWTLKKPYVGGNEGKAGWKVSGSSLTTRNAVWADFGGHYNLAKNLRELPAWEGTVGNIYAGYKTQVLDKTGFYYEYDSGSVYEGEWRFLVRDARTGAIEGDYKHPGKIFGAGSGTTFSNAALSDLYTGDVNTAYFVTSSRSGVRGAGLRLYNITTGELLQDYPNVTSVPPTGWNSSVSPGSDIQHVLFSDDKNFMYVTSRYSNGENTFSTRYSLYLTKYSVHQKTALWTVLLGQQDDYSTHFQSQPLATDKYGNIHVTYFYRGIFQYEKDYKSAYKVFNANGYQINAHGLYLGVYSGVVASPDKSKVHAATTRFVSGRYGFSKDVGLISYNADTNGFNHVEVEGNIIEEIQFPSYFYTMPAVNKYDMVQIYNGAIVTPGGSIERYHPSSVIKSVDRILAQHNTLPNYAIENVYDTTGYYAYNNNQFVSPQIIAQPSGDFYTLMRGSKWKYRWKPAGQGTTASATPVSYERYMAVMAPNQSDLLLDGKGQTEWIYGYNGMADQLLGKEYVDSTKAAPDGSLFLNTNDYYRLGAFGNSEYKNMVVPLVGESAGDLPRLLDDNTVEVESETWGGLLFDPTSVMRNQVLEFNVSVNSMSNNKVIGAAIRIQDEKNLYAVEWSQDTLILYRVVNGTKTELARTYLARHVGIPAAFKIEAIGKELRIIVNQIKRLEVSDGTYAAGTAGLLSLGQQMAAFSQVKRTNYGNSYPQNTYEAVLVNDPISYEKLFQDIESDAMGTEEWSYSHNPSFFENAEGLSIHNGKTYPATINALERAGLYEITFRSQDNPGLASYRKWSQPVKKIIYAHRRPVAQPDVRFTGKVFAEGESLDYETFDTSYDPDIARILSDKVFRTRWSDESKWTTGKREYYNRPGVELIVQEQVRDIHGAWSYWAQTIVFKAGIPPVNQTKPVMTISYPTGTTAAAPTVLIKEPKITWSYYDAEGDPQESYRLIMTYADNNETALFVELEGSALHYQMLSDTITPGRVVKVQGQAYSAGVWSNLSNIRYFVLDLPPATYLLSYSGVDGNNPIFTNSNRPQLRTFVVDPENHPIAAVDYEVFRASNGVAAVDTNAATAALSYIPNALAEGLHYWRARSNDSFMWGPYSSNGFFFVDTLKPADVNEQLNIEPTAVTVSFNAFSDADPSSGHAARMFYLQRVNPDGSIANIDLNNDGTKEYSIPLALDRQSYRVTGLVAGERYRVTVLDYDVAGNEGHYAYIYFVTNRPPTGDFDWSPKPVYEGDMVSFSSNVADPDGNTLSMVYELTSPLGVRSSFSYSVNGPAYQARGPSLKLTAVGAWSMKLTVSDGIADPVSVTKLVQVLPLHVAARVKHTDLWDKRRIDYNVDKSGNPESPRGYKIFWAGEKFVLEADTTLTGTATKAERVEVKMLSYFARLDKNNAAQTSWSGELWEHAFVDFEQGKLQFVFKAYYSNGTIKEDTAEVSIDGNMLNTVGVHRVQ